MFNIARGLRTGLTVAMVALAVVRCGRAAERTLSASDALNATSFNTGLNWDDGQPPSAGNTYVVPGGLTLRTPTSGSHTFAGDQLTISGTMLWKGPDNTAVTISDFVLRGALNHGQGNSQGRINGNISIPEGVSATISLADNSDRRIFHIYASLSGTGSLRVPIPRNSSDMKEIRLFADNSAYTGSITLSGKGKLTIGSEENLGGNPPAWNPSQLVFNGTVLRSSNSLTLDDPNRGIWLNNQSVPASELYPGGRFEIAGGTVTTIACVIGGDGPLEKTDSGTLILAATNTYTGATTVSSGTLLVNSPTNATASLAVTTGATLGGTGTVHGVVSVAADATLALAGNGFGTLALANPAGLSLNGASLSFDAQDPADGPTDSLALAGPLSLAGAGTVTVNIPATGLPAGSYTLIAYPSWNGAGTLELDYPYPNAELVIGDTAVTLEITGSGTTPDMVWKGNITDNTWSFAVGNWLPAEAPFRDGVDVRFTDDGVASVPVVLAADAAPRDMTIQNTGSSAYTLDTGIRSLSARNVSKSGNAVLTLKGDHRYGTLTVTAGACTLDALLDLSASLSVSVSAGTFVQNATSVISGGGNLTLAGTANLYGTNTFAGTLAIGTANNTRTVTIYNDQALGSTAGGTVIRGGTTTGYNRLLLANGVTVTDETLTITGGASVRSGLWSAGNSVCAWDGDITIASDGNLFIGSGAGSIFTIGDPGRTVITNAGNAILWFRDSGTVALNSTLAMPAANAGRDDSGTLVIRSAGNRVNGFNLVQGSVRLEADEPFAPAPGLLIGKASDTNPGNKATLDLNGHRLTVRSITDAHGDAYNGTSNEGYQRILCSVPSTLTVNGDVASSYTKVGSVMSGPLTFIKDGSGTFTLGQINALSGAVIVSNGVLNVTSTGSLGAGATNVIIAGGALALGSDTALHTTANVTFAEGGAGMIDLPAGVNVTVSTLWHGERQRYAGTYGAQASGAQYVDNTRFSGSGTLTVLHGSGGTLIMLR